MEVDYGDSYTCGVQDGKGKGAYQREGAYMRGWLDRGFTVYGAVSQNR